VPQTQLIRSAPGAWRWVKLPELLPSTTSENELLRRGYQLLSPDRLKLAACTAGQMGRLVLLDQQKNDRLWVHKQDLAWAEEYPAALGVIPPEALLHLFPFGTIDLNTRRPPPGLGRLAFLAEGEHWYLLEHPLSAEMEQLYQQLDQHILALWGNPGGMFDAALLWICRAQGGYELQRQIWQEARLRLNSTDSSRRWRILPKFRNKENEEQVQLKEKLLHLEQARHMIQAPPPTGKDWDELRSQAQQLAAAHYRAGRPTTRPVSFHIVEKMKVPQQASQKKPSAFAASALSIPTDQVSRVIMRALREQTRYHMHGALARLRCELPEFDSEQKILLHLTFPASLQKGLGDHLLTTWLAIVSLLIQKQEQPGELTTFKTVSGREILSYLLLAKRNGSFVPEQYQRLSQEVALLSQMYLRLSWSKSLGGGQARIAYPLLEVEFNEGQLGRQEPNFLALGGWVRAIPDFMAQSCSTSRAFLKLTPLAQRLGLELLLEFSQSPNGVNVELGTLLNRSGIIVKAHSPQEKLGPVEKAFKQLAEAGIIANTPYFSRVEGSKVVYYFRWLGGDRTVREQQRIVEGRFPNWWQHYLNQRIHIDPARPALTSATALSPKDSSIQRVSGSF